jgi:hypothetical protein
MIENARAHEAACVDATRAALASQAPLGEPGTRVLYVEARDSAMCVTLQYGSSFDYAVRSYSFGVGDEAPDALAAQVVTSLGGRRLRMTKGRPEAALRKALEVDAA